MRNWAQRQGETKQRLTEARNDLERDQEALERRVRDEGVVGPGAVEEARGYRDTLWDPEPVNDFETVTIAIY